MALFVLLLLCAAGLLGVETPEGTVLQLRLKTALSSYTSKPGTPVLAEVVSPVVVNGKVVLPMRTELIGVVKEARKVGLGFSSETAMLHLEFTKIEAPGKGLIPLKGRVTRIDDARERVDAEGRIRGIRATDTVAAKLSGYAITAASFDPMAMMFALTASQSVFRLPDSSVVLPAGAEFQFKIDEKLVWDGEFGEQYPELKLDVAGVVKDMPFRTATENDNTPSDLTSLLYVGSREAIERAFAAAGWVRSDALDGKSTYGVMRSIVENQGYRAAPMSVLTLHGKRPELTYAKTLNTFFSRHHLRIYQQPGEVAGQGVWTSTATYDSGIGFSRAAKTFIHIINENIDDERTKVINDLVLTGCVSGVGYVDRPWVPRDAKNATGDTLRTDGRIAVLHMNECRSAARASDEDRAKQDQDPRLRQSAFVRPWRNTVLTFRNDLLRGNIIYQTYYFTKLGIQGLKAKSAVNGEQRSFTYGGQVFEIVEGAKPMPKKPQVSDPGHKVKLHVPEHREESYAKHWMFSLNGGLTGFGNNVSSTLPLEFRLNTGQVADVLRLTSSFERGWSLSTRVTLNTHKHIAHEFSYSRNITNFKLVGRDDLGVAELDQRSKAAIRTFSYNTLFHLRPLGARWRPYVAAGPAIQLIHLLDAKPTSSRVLRLAARDVALFVTAFDFGTKPAIEGGGVFQWGFNYGAGSFFHLNKRFFLRADYRETLSGQPDIWKGSATKLADGGTVEAVTVNALPLEKNGLLRHQVVTIGFGIGF
jgi:hypothetical protein